MAERLGFIGFGIMGQRLLRAAHAHDSSVIQVSGIYDPNPNAALELGKVDSDYASFDSIEEVIQASDCLHIASPPLSHLDYLAQCSQAGRAALCEKPLATDIAAATSLVNELESNAMRAAVNFPMASSFAVDYLQSWIDEGFIGSAQKVDIELKFPSWPRAWQMDAIEWLDRRAEGGFTREVGSHFLFLSRRMCGPLQLRSATSTYPDQERTEHTIDVTFNAGQLPATMTGKVGATSKPDHNTWTLTGDSGRIRLRDWSVAEQEIDGQWVAPADALDNELARPLILERQLNKVAAMSRGEHTNLATLREALEVQQVVEEILQS